MAECVAAKRNTENYLFRRAFARKLRALPLHSSISLKCIIVNNIYESLHSPSKNNIMFNPLKVLASSFVGNSRVLNYCVHMLPR